MSGNEEAENGISFRVLVNEEEQYSLWREGWPDAPGWKETGHAGTREECLEYVKLVWTDMRPLSLRRKMEAQSFSSDRGTDGSPFTTKSCD